MKHRHSDLLQLLGLIALFSGVLALGRQILTEPLQAQQPQALQAAPLTSTLRLSNIQVVDGDTLHADVHLPYGVTLTHETIRVNDYDAWESRRVRRTVGQITNEELAKGLKAKATLQTWAEDKGSPLTLAPPSPDNPQRDNYGRLLGTLVRKGQSIAIEMQRLGHTRPTPLKLEEPDHEQF